MFPAPYSVLASRCRPISAVVTADLYSICEKIVAGNRWAPRTYLLLLMINALFGDCWKKKCSKTNACL